ncbi:hypothetical protein BGZ89_003338 [Linnemannia elongata]|nr:hypothetical protein BGZ89_003338 [Linnemannia elongata]
MINITDFFPAHTQEHLTSQERMQIDSYAVGSSALLLNLPLRYVLEYAMNHLQRSDNISYNNNTRAVLIVTDHQVDLQEAIRRERQVCKDLYSSLSSSTPSSSIKEMTGMDPWAHLWPLPRPSPPDEYSTETPPSSPTTKPSISSSEHQQESKELKTSFRDELWARIQIRYAPTIRHVQSLFRCLHLDPGSTQGKTFGSGGSSCGDAYESAVPSSSTTTTGEVGGSVTPPMPTLVILLGCFGHDRSLDIRRFSMLDIVPTFAGLQTVGEKDYSVERGREENESGSRARQGGAGGRIGRPEGDIESFARDNNDDGREEEEEEEENDLNAEELEGLEYTEYIRMVANTMAEIKDSLNWLERTSGCEPELLVVEDIGQDHPDPSQPQEIIMIPTVRELWLKTVLGFWVDTFIKTESSLSPQLQQQQQQQHDPRRESYRLWIQTHESLSATFTTTAIAVSQSTSAEKGGLLSGAAATATAASMGAVLGVQWYFDSTGDRFQFQVVQ